MSAMMIVMGAAEDADAGAAGDAMAMTIAGGVVLADALAGDAVRTIATSGVDAAAVAAPARAGTDTCTNGAAHAAEATAATA